MKKKTCQNCGKKYIPKSNNSKYCTKKCKNQRDIKWRKTQKQNNLEYKEKINKQRMKRFKERYNNEPEYKKQHKQSAKQWQQKNKEKYHKIVLKSYYKNHEKNKQRQAQKHKERYWNNPEYREKIKQRNREFNKTENGKIATKKHKAKRRKLGTLNLLGNQIILPKETQPEFSHINPIIGCLLPKITHNLIPGTNKKEHTQNTIKWIQKIYQLDLQKILNK